MQNGDPRDIFFYHTLTIMIDSYIMRSHILATLFIPPIVPNKNAKINVLQYAQEKNIELVFLAHRCIYEQMFQFRTFKFTYSISFGINSKSHQTLFMTILLTILLGFFFVFNNVY